MVAHYAAFWCCTDCVDSGGLAPALAPARFSATTTKVRASFSTSGFWQNSGITNTLHDELGRPVGFFFNHAASRLSGGGVFSVDLGNGFLRSLSCGFGMDADSGF